jgi:hypothetical protein
MLPHCGLVAASHPASVGSAGLNRSPIGGLAPPHAVRGDLRPGPHARPASGPHRGDRPRRHRALRGDVPLPDDQPGASPPCPAARSRRGTRAPRSSGAFGEGRRRADIQPAYPLTQHELAAAFALHTTRHTPGPPKLACMAAGGRHRPRRAPARGPPHRGGDEGRRQQGGALEHDDGGDGGRHGLPEGPRRGARAAGAAALRGSTRPASIESLD